ncbi:cobalamin B12-binding domain-containing protein [Azospirillum canadense]|uniref:cobalamin B12-binding domain-containing protein n=1 Tax=Azospirillum canadense TaxID=403962 RepID=UPI0022266B4F|nr:cobalamin-dependent protein [Azospirillum canadense]MCW2243058.1 methanogenic corrinoid protein MtbC1 [Azospirillum canadense]
MLGTIQAGMRPVRPPPNSIAPNPIASRCDELARAVVAIQFERWPALYARYGEAGCDKCAEDLRFHVLYLAEAVAANRPALFREYVGWVKVLFANIGIPVEELGESLEILRDVIAARVDDATAERVRACVAAALDGLPGMAVDVPRFIAEDAPHGALAKTYLDRLLAGDRRGATTLVLDRVEGGMAVADVYLHVFQPTLREVGRLWQTGAISVAHEHFATAATQAVMAQLYPRIFAAERCNRSMVATCVSGELHEVGIRMVADFFEMSGWDTYYLGANAPARAIVQAVRERNAHILAVSATISAHVGTVTDLIAAVRAELGDQPLRILVGGYPFNLVPDLWKAVGADACAVTAAEAISVAGALADSLPGAA